MIKNELKIPPELRPASLCDLDDKTFDSLLSKQETLTGKIRDYASMISLEEIALASSIVLSIAYTVSYFLQK